MKAFLLLCFLIAGMWDGLTTVLGTAVIVKAQAYLQYGFCLAGAIVVTGFTFGTQFIFSKNDLPHRFFRFGWFMAVAFDVYTSFMGNARYVVLGQPIKTLSDEGFMQTVAQMTMQQFLIVAALTILVSGSPIGFSYLIADRTPFQKR